MRTTNNNFTLDDLSAMRYNDLSASSGRFSQDMTDKQWQNRFEIMKAMCIPSDENKLPKCSSTYSSCGEYKGDTMWQYYTIFINDTLKEIRAGRKGYCWFAYQIKDLLRFEKDRLRTKYNQDEQYVLVWLES